MAAVVRRERRYGREGHGTYPVVKCGCGAEVHCPDGWSNACEGCGTEFNGAGQTLAPRRFWGEETGESFA